MWEVQNLFISEYKNKQLSTDMLKDNVILRTLKKVQHL